MASRLGSFKIAIGLCAAFISSGDYRIFPVHDLWRAFFWPEIRLIAHEHDLWTGVGFSDSIFTSHEFKPETPILTIVFVGLLHHQEVNIDEWVTMNVHRVVKSCSRVVNWWIHDFPRTKWTQHYISSLVKYENIKWMGGGIFGENSAKDKFMIVSERARENVLLFMLL